MARRNALQDYLAVQLPVDKEMAAILRDAAAESDRIIARLAEKSGIGGQVRRAQLQVMKNELYRVQTQMWGQVEGVTASGMKKAARAAAKAESLLDDVGFQSLGIHIPELAAAHQAAADEVVANLLARRQNNIGLSEKVYRSKAFSNGLIGRKIDQGIVLGLSQKELAASVRSLIRPDVAGGVSYASNRLARTEINNAYHRAQINHHAQKPWSEGFIWHLSGSHPRPDECNDYDGQKYAWERVPDKPHPQCLCYLEATVKPVDQFIKEFRDGDYNSYIDETIYSNGLGVC